MDVKAQSFSKVSKKTLQSERTKQSLLRAADRLFARRGYESARLDDVAAAARVTKGALYHQFRDKRDLFETVLADRAVELVKSAKRESRKRSDELGAGRHGPERYRAALEIVVDALCEPGNRTLLLIEGPAVLGRERWEDVVGSRLFSLVGSMFRDFFRYGTLKPDLIDPLTHMLYGAFLEMAQAIAHAEDPAVARERFGQAGLWVMEAMLRQSGTPLEG
jgi:AcrR family transcriptional regulator